MLGFAINVSTPGRGQLLIKGKNRIKSNIPILSIYED
jgi:hypothetical protein